MRVASWNVNSLRVRLPQVLEWIATSRPDILAMQEIKLQDEQFPVAAFQEIGYFAQISGQKTYNGVAIVSRMEATAVIRDVPGLDDPQRRILGVTIDGVRVLNLYVPNGESVDSDKYRYKLEWLDKITAHVESDLRTHPRLIVLGDFNVAPEPIDVHDPAAWEGKVLYSEPERAAFRRLLDLGLCDTFRLRHPDDTAFSWWDYRMAGFRRNLGLRIDHILASKDLCTLCKVAAIDKGPRGWERPSDHAPVVAEFLC